VADFEALDIDEAGTPPVIVESFKGDIQIP